MFFFIFFDVNIISYRAFLSIDILHKNYTLDLYKMTMGYFVQMQKKL